MSEFLERLKQRKIVQWALAYVAAAFALIQVLDIVVQRFGWPEQTIRFVIVALAVGFFVTLVLAWYHGERGSQRVGGVELLILALLLAIGGLAIWQFGPRNTTVIAAKSDTDPKSIAVLPFVNMSGDKNNEYFSDGISEEILNVLAGMPGLRVAARTSSFSFREGKHDAPEIAQELHVRMLLEGSVRKQGDRARITAQLIDANEGYHLWSQTYDRELKDIFAVQDEIAAAVADELKVKIGGDGAPRKARSAQAHDEYLRGLALWQQRGERQLLEAARHFENAIAADPEFAEAYAGLGLVYTILPDYTATISYTDALDRARDYAERALALDPNVPEIYPALGYLADGVRRRETAQALFRRAIALRPSFGTAYQWLGNSLSAAGNPKDGLAALERASSIDPRSTIIANNHGMVLMVLGRYDEAIALCANTLKADPREQNCLEMTSFALLLKQEHAAARAMYIRYADVINPGAVPFVNTVFDALDGQGDRHAVAARLANFGLQSTFVQDSGNAFGIHVIPPLLIQLGEPGMVMQYLTASGDVDRSGEIEWATMLVALGKLHCAPDFVAFVAHIKTVDPHYATLCTK